MRTSHRTVEPRAAQAAGRLDRRDRAAAAVGGGAATGGDEHAVGAARDRGGDQLPGAGARRGLGVAFLDAHQGQPAGGRDLDERRAAVSQQREGGLDLAPERIRRRRRHDVTAQALQQHRHRALAAVGDGAAIHAQARALEPAGDRGGDGRSAQRALEGVGGDQDRPLAKRHGAPFFQRDGAPTDAGDRLAVSPGSEAITIEAAGREVRISNPGKVFFPEPGFTKLDLVNYYLQCSEAVLLHLRERPTTLKRWVNGVTGEFFFQKRVPETRAGVAPDRDRALPERPLRPRARRLLTPRTSRGASTSA